MTTRRVIHGDMRAVLPQLGATGVRFHAVVTDPPYELAFMGRRWDQSGVSFRPATWRAVYDVLLPGGHMLVFGGTRTQHRMVCAIEDAGFEIRDTLMWVYGQGFPKSHDVSKAIDRAAGAEREDIGPNLAHHGGGTNNVYAQDAWTKENFANKTRLTAPATPEAAQWSGWGTALKPAWEPIILARKRLAATVAENVLRHGCGGLNIDASRVGIDPTDDIHGKNPHTVNSSGPGFGQGGAGAGYIVPAGRWPANVLHDGSDEVEAAFAAFGERTSGTRNGEYANGTFSSGTVTRELEGSSGSASRFFYSAKADRADRADSRHPTVKPVDLMRWLCQLITPPGGHILDPFAGSGTTGEAAMLLGMDCTMIDADAQHVADIEHRATRWSGGDLPLFREAAD